MAAPATTSAPESTTVAVISTAEQYGTQLEALKAKFNVLTPFAQIGGLAPQHSIFTTVITIDSNPDAKDVYDGVDKDGNGKLQYLKVGEVALAKNGLRKVAEGLGISIIRIDDLAVGLPHYWNLRVHVAYRGVDGSWVIRQGSEEWDLRDGSDRARQFRPAQLIEARKHGQRNCETRAINAAIRECGAGVKQVYTRAELGKPFVAFRVNFVPDMSDPDTRRIVTERAMLGASALYAQQASTPAPAPTATGDPWADTPTGSVVSVGGGATAAASGKAPADTAAPKTDTPPSDRAVKVLDVKFVKDGKGRHGKWELHRVSFSNGQSYTTLDAGITDDAKKAKADGAWVEYDTAVDGEYTNLSDIYPPQPRLTDLADMDT